MNDVLQSVPGVVLQEPIEFSIKIRYRYKYQKWLQKKKILPEKKHFVVKPLCLAACYRLSRLVVPIENVDKEAFSNIVGLLDSVARHMPAMVEIVAIAITDAREKPDKKLIKFLFETLTQEELKQLSGMIIGFLNLQAFMISIISFKGVMNLLMKKEKDMSRQSTGEIIAPGI